MKFVIAPTLLCAMFIGGFFLGKWSEAREAPIRKDMALQGCEVVMHQAYLDKQEAEHDAWRCTSQLATVLKAIRLEPESLEP